MLEDEGSPDSGLLGNEDVDALEGSSLEESHPKSRGLRRAGLLAVSASLAGALLSTRGSWSTTKDAYAAELPPEYVKGIQDGTHPRPHPLEHDGVFPELVGVASCGACVPDCPAMANTLMDYKVQDASKAPASLKLDLTFYKKYVNVMGIPVLSSDKVCDCNLKKAAWLAHGLLSHIKDRAKVVEKMKLQGSRLAVMAHEEKTTDIPEHSHLTPKEFWDLRARGLGATVWAPASSVGEENVMCEPASVNPYFGENILIHEFVHGIARTGFDMLLWDGKDWDVFNGAAYAKSRGKGLWDDTYAAENKIEYFSELTQAYFDVNVEAHCCSSSSDCTNGIHNCVNTRAELETYDKDGIEHMKRVWKEDSWRPGTGSTCGCKGTKAELTEGYVPLDMDGNVAVKTCHGNAGGAACSFPFVWNGASHDKCIIGGVDGDKKWCYTNPEKTSWGVCECDETPEDDAPIDGPKIPTCHGNSNGAFCHFPFTYDGQTFNACTTYGAADPNGPGDGCPWCGTNADASEWGDCECSALVSTCGGTANGAHCHFPFTYDGQTFTECTKYGFHTFWCGTDKDTSKWGFCGCSDKEGANNEEPLDPCCSFDKTTCEAEENCEWGGHQCRGKCSEMKAKYACHSLGGCAWAPATETCYPCVDTHDSSQHCEYWANNGECTGPAASWMAKHCSMACSTDSDTTEHCKYWAKNGECENNPSYMLDSCKTSCACSALE